MASQFPAEVYREVANRLRGQSYFTNSHNVRADMEAIAHAYDLVAEESERLGAREQSSSADETGARDR